MSVTFWKEMPEINRKIAFTASYISSGAGLGCHCGTISSVSAYIPAPYSGGRKIPHIDVIKPVEGDREVKTAMRDSGTYRGFYTPVQEELDKINGYLEKNPMTLDDCSEQLCKSVIACCENIPIWVLSDVVNYLAPARNSGDPYHPPITSGKKILQMDMNGTTLFSRTVTFAEHLIRNKIGYIFESPIVQNPSHRTWGGYSLNRVWLWIPPNHLERALGVTAQYGQEKFPTVDAWKNTIFNEVQRLSCSAGKYVCGKLDPSITADTVEKAVFDGGVFPDEKRFSAKEA